MTGRLVVALFGLAMAGCQCPRTIGDGGEAKYERIHPSDVRVLVDLPAGATVLGDIEIESSTSGSAVPRALDAAIRSAAELGANAVVIEEEGFSLGRDREFVRVKAIRVSK